MDCNKDIDKTIRDREEARRKKDRKRSESIEKARREQQDEDNKENEKVNSDSNWIEEGLDMYDMYA